MSPERDVGAEITARLLVGLCVREIMRELRVGKDRVNQIKRTLVLPPCACGKPPGHQGWCAARLARSPQRRHFVTHLLPERNRAHPPRGYVRSASDRARRSDARVGIPKKAGPETIADCKAQPLSVRRFYQRARLALAAAARLDRAFENDGAHSVIDVFFADLIQPEPTPLQRLLEKEQQEEWEREEHRFWLWQHSASAT